IPNTKIKSTINAMHNKRMLFLKTTVGLLLIGLCCLTSFGAAAQKINLPASFRKTFTGKVTGNPVRLILKATGEDIHGSYFYSKNAAPVQLMQVPNTAENDTLILAEHYFENHNRQQSFAVWKLL